MGSISAINGSQGQSVFLQPSTGAVKTGGVPAKGQIVKGDVFEGAKQIATSTYNMGPFRPYMLTWQKFAKRASELPGAVAPNRNNTPMQLPGHYGALIPPPMPPEPNWGGTVGTKGGDILQIRVRKPYG